MITDDDASDFSDGIEDVVPAKKATTPKAKAKPQPKKPTAAAPRRHSARSAQPDPEPEPEPELEEEEKEQELAPEVNDIEDDDDEEDDDDDDQTFVVESILGHHFEKDVSTNRRINISCFTR